jgi:hypothetical protein
LGFDLELTGFTLDEITALKPVELEPGLTDEDAPFAGSGSTLIACEKTGRINRSMELDPKYCDVIVQRWQEFTGQTATNAEINWRAFQE